MAKYCDSDVLERNWFLWLVADAVPVLEPYRISGVLWTKAVGEVQDSAIKIHGKLLVDPMHPLRLHCIAFERQLHFATDKGASRSKKPLPLAVPYHSQYTIYGGKVGPDHLAVLEEDGYFLELPTVVSWQNLINDINKMCDGIALNFHQKSEQARKDLAHGALIQVMNKLEKKKLLYKPGKAPVFNLLTTTIHRCMCSILTRETRQRRNSTKYVEKKGAEIIDRMPRPFRSLQH